MGLKICLAAALFAQAAGHAATAEHFLLLQTGSDWCVAGEDVRKTFEGKRFKAALAEGPDWALAVYDDMENPPPGVADANKKLAGRRVETRRFPAMTCTGPDSRDGKTVRFFAQLENLPRDVGARKLAEMVNRALENKKRAEALFAKAEKLRAVNDPSGAADAYGEGFDILLSQAGSFFSARIHSGLHSYAGDWKALMELDKDDRYGWKMHFTMSGVDIVEKATGFAKSKNFEGGGKYIENLRKTPQKHWSADQRQCIDIAEFALWREAPGREARNAALLEHALSLGRDTLWGQCALGALTRMGRKIEKRPRFRAKVRPRPAADRAAVARKTWENAVKRDRMPNNASSGAETRGMTAAAKLEVARAAVARRIGDSPVWDRPGSKAFAEEFLNDRAWMEDFVWSGDADWPKAILALESLYWQDAGRWHSRGRNDTGRRVMTAMALECSGRDEAWLADYLDAFRETWREGRIHKKALSQDVWLWRFALQQSHPQSHSDDPANQQRFMQKFTNLPANRYGGAHWMVPYRMNNCFGVSVHTPFYYEYWRLAGEWPQRKYSYIVGGVCGELSKFGSACSNSHGIPSTTAGQPAHCAYVRRIPGGTWTIENSVSGPTDMHLRLFGGGAWTFTLAYEDTFGGDRDRRLAAERLCELAFLAEKGGADRARVEKLYKTAVRRASRHYPSRRAYSQWLERSGAPLECHRAFIEDTLAKAGAWRQPAWDFVTRYLDRVAKGKGAAAHAEELAGLAPLLRQPDGKIREEASFRRMLQIWTAPECNAAKTDGGRLLAKVLKAFLAAQNGTRDYFAQTLGWGCDRMMGDPCLAAAYMEAVESAVAASGGKSGLDFDMLFAVASRSGGVKTFRQLAALQDRLAPPQTKGEPYPAKDFGGAILSADGLLQTSSQAKPNAPRLYPRCIDRSPCGGRTFHTAAEKAPSATVVLPGAAQIAGVVVENRGPADLKEKQLPLVVWVSEDGKSWTEVFACAEPRQTYRIDLSAAAPRAGFVRVGRRPGAKNDSFQLDKILVYGKKLY